MDSTPGKGSTFRFTFPNVAITELAEYYPTRTEAAIFAAHGAAMAQAVHARIGSGYSLVPGHCPALVPGSIKCLSG